MAGAPRWRVAIIDDHDASRAELRAAIEAAGGEVAGEAVRRADALAVVRRTRPDVGVFSVGGADGDGVAAVAEVTAAAACPIVLLASHADDALVARAVAAGVMGYLLKPLRRQELAAALEVAVARFREAVALRRELEERKVVERAKGLLMRRHGLTEDEAYRRIRRAAMDSRRPMVEVARALLVSETVVGDGR